jgi:hypothetical protein
LSRRAAAIRSDAGAPLVAAWCERSLTTLKEKLIKVGAKVIRHAGCLTFQMAEVAIRRNIFQ